MCDSAATAANGRANPKAQTIPTEILREKIRIYSNAQRKNKREKCTDALRFGLEEIQSNITELHKFTEDDVRSLTARIKHSKQASTEDMYRLCHAFLQSENNIITFVNITGAMQLIIKELTGVTVSHQLCAAECLCNLALGPNFVCEKIAKMAGSYLTTYLDNTALELKRTILWTLANVLASNKSTAQILIQMGLVAKLWRLYTANDTNNLTIEDASDFRYEAGQCLQLLSSHIKCDLRQEDKDYIGKNLQLKDANSSKGNEFYLQIIWHFDIINQRNCTLDTPTLNHLINFCLTNLQKTENFINLEQHLKILYAVRVLANMLSVYEGSAFNLLLEQLPIERCNNLAALFSKLFERGNTALTREICWLLNNLLIQQEQHGELAQNFLNQLMILESSVLTATGFMD